MNNKPYNQNTMKTRKEFNIERVREFCKLVNQGVKPHHALTQMNACSGYVRPLKKSGLYWKEKNGTYKAVERVRVDRYESFVKAKNEYNKMNYLKYEKQSVQKKKSYTQFVKQASLFNQPKPKQPTTNAPTMKAKERQLNFIQRVVKSIFNL
jgi:hypothetical protein